MRAICTTYTHSRRAYKMSTIDNVCVFQHVACCWLNKFEDSNKQEINSADDKDTQLNKRKTKMIAVSVNSYLKMATYTQSRKSLNWLNFGWLVFRNDSVGTSFFLLYLALRLIFIMYECCR